MALSYNGTMAARCCLIRTIARLLMLTLRPVLRHQFEAV
jgi:hypothetical protein